MTRFFSVILIFSFLATAGFAAYLYFQLVQLQDAFIKREAFHRQTEIVSNEMLSM